MPDKSRHSKGKHPHQSKKSKARQREGAVISSRPVTNDTPAPANTAITPPAPSTPAPQKKSAAVPHPYIAAELKRIGILAGIIIVILIVLALIIS